MKRIFNKYSNLLAFCLTALLIGSAVFAQTESVIVGQHEIRQKINAFLESCYINQPARFETEWISDIPVWKIGQDIDSIAVHYGRNSLPRSQTIVRIEAYHNGRVIRRLSYSLRVRVFAQVFVSNENISSKTPLNPQQFTIAEEEITAVSGDPLLADASLANQQTRRFVRNGAILTTEMIEAIPLVARGDLITLRYDTGTIQVELQARAQQDGGAGEEIWCMGADGRKRYRARIESETTAALIP